MNFFWGKEPEKKADADDDGILQTTSTFDLLSLPTSEAGAFYDQLNKEIEGLREKVDSQLRDMVEASRKDITVLESKLREIQSAESTLTPTFASLVDFKSSVQSTDSNVTEPVANLSGRRKSRARDSALSPSEEAKLLGVVRMGMVEECREDDENDDDETGGHNDSQDRILQTRAYPNRDTNMSLDQDAKEQSTMWWKAPATDGLVLMEDQEDRRRAVKQKDAAEIDAIDKARKARKTPTAQFLQQRSETSNSNPFDSGSSQEENEESFATDDEKSAIGDLNNIRNQPSLIDAVSEEVEESVDASEDRKQLEKLNGQASSLFSPQILNLTTTLEDAISRKRDSVDPQNEQPIFVESPSSKKASSKKASSKKPVNEDKDRTGIRNAKEASESAPNNFSWFFSSKPNKSEKETRSKTLPLTPETPPPRKQNRLRQNPDPPIDKKKVPSNPFYSKRFREQEDASERRTARDIESARSQSLTPTAMVKSENSELSPSQIERPESAPLIASPISISRISDDSEEETKMLPVDDPYFEGRSFTVKQQKSNKRAARAAGKSSMKYQYMTHSPSYDEEYDDERRFDVEDDDSSRKQPQMSSRSSMRNSQRELNYHVDHDDQSLEQNIQEWEQNVPYKKSQESHLRQTGRSASSSRAITVHRHQSNYRTRDDHDSYALSVQRSNNSQEKNLRSDWIEDSNFLRRNDSRQKSEDSSKRSGEGSHDPMKYLEETSWKNADDEFDAKISHQKESRSTRGHDGRNHHSNSHDTNRSSRSSNNARSGYRSSLTPNDRKSFPQDQHKTNPSSYSETTQRSKSARKASKDYSWSDNSLQHSIDDLYILQHDSGTGEKRTVKSKARREESRKLKSTSKREEVVKTTVSGEYSLGSYQHDGQQLVHRHRQSTDTQCGSVRDTPISNDDDFNMEISSALVEWEPPKEIPPSLKGSKIDRRQPSPERLMRTRTIVVDRRNNQSLEPERVFFQPTPEGSSAPQVKESKKNRKNKKLSVETNQPSSFSRAIVPHVGKEVVAVPKATQPANATSSNTGIVTIQKTVKNGQMVILSEVQGKQIKDPYGDEGRYTGIMLDGLPHGQGTMHYSDGRSYTGEWRSGRWHGKGRAKFVNGDVYVGKYERDRRHGKGRYEWADGRVYDGKFVRNQRHGQGSYTWPDGASYVGEFVDGRRHGEGCYRFADGSVYKGEWQNGKYDGIGECVWASGRKYHGEWRAGKAQGYGVEFRADGTIRHQGEWKKDRPVRRRLEP